MSTITTDSGAQAAVSFREYDSTIFPTFPQCIAHAVRNPLLIENLSDWREVSFEGKTMLVHVMMLLELSSYLVESLYVLLNLLRDQWGTYV